MENKPELHKISLKIDAEVVEKMNRLRILEEDVCEVIELGEASKRRIANPERATYTCYRELGNITYWVEYRVLEKEYEVVNVYTHRMKIKLEGMWNGRKTEIDL